MKGKRRGCLAKLGLLGAGIVAALLLGEGLVRVYATLFFPRLMTVDRRLGWRHNPNRSKAFVNEDGERNLVVQNAYGHRGRAHGSPKAAGKFRVLVLGDSFAEGVHVSEEQLVTRLLEDGDPTLEVINAGVGAWGTVQEYLYLREAGPVFRPDLVLVMFYENDLADNCMPYSPGIGPRPHAVLEAGKVRIVEDYDDARYLEFVAPLPFRSFLVRNSYLFYALNEHLWQRLRRDALRRIEDADRNALEPDAMLTVFFAVVTRMQTLLRDVHAELALALIPPKPALAGALPPTYGAIVAFCEKQGVAALSLFPALQAAHRRGERVYFEDDIHWTKLGHAVAARALQPFLQGRR